MARKLRIAASLFFGLLTVVMLLMWWRSYWWGDILELSFGKLTSYKYRVVSFNGQCWVGKEFAHTIPRLFSFESQKASVAVAIPNASGKLTHMMQWTGSISPVVPHWSLALAFAIVAYASQLRLKSHGYRFSLRTLLIATTLVAAVLGLLVWMVR